MFGISCCEFIIKTTIQVGVWLWQTNSLTASYVHSHLRKTKLFRSSRQSSAQSRVFPRVYFCDISNIKHFPWWGFHHPPQNSVVQIALSAGRGTFVVRLYCLFLIKSHYFHVTQTFNTLLSSLQSFLSHSAVRDFCISVSYLPISNCWDYFSLLMTHIIFWTAFGCH